MKPYAEAGKQPKSNVEKLVHIYEMKGVKKAVGFYKDEELVGTATLNTDDTTTVCMLHPEKKCYTSENGRLYYIIQSYYTSIDPELEVRAILQDFENKIGQEIEEKLEQEASCEDCNASIAADILLSTVDEETRGELKDRLLKGELTLNDLAQHTKAEKEAVEWLRKKVPFDKKFKAFYTKEY